MSLFEISERAQQYQTDLLEFMDSQVYPAEAAQHRTEDRRPGNSGAIIAEGVMRRAIDEPQNKATAGTPTVTWIDARVHKATEIADAAGIGIR
jgi:hypothetical protein